MSAVMEPPAADRPVLEPQEAIAARQPKQSNKTVFILFSGEIDKVWAALIMATASAAMGKDTSIYFTFWGFQAIVKENRGITGQNWMQKMMSFMNRGGISHLKVSKMNFGGAGRSMMLRLAKQYHSAPPSELLEAAVDLGVKLYPCQMTMELFGYTRDDMIDGLGEPAGAAAMLAAAEGATTFFI